MSIIVGVIHTIVREMLDIPKVIIELSRDGGVSWELIASEVIIDHEKIGDQEVFEPLLFPWLVTSPASDNCLFRFSGLEEYSDIVRFSTDFTIHPEGTIDKISITYEPHVFVALGDRMVTLSHKRDSDSKIIYRVSEFLCKDVISDTYIHTVSGATVRDTSNSGTVKYSMKIVSPVVPTSARLDLAAEIFSLIMYVAGVSNLHIGIYTDRARLRCEGDYTQVRQSGVNFYGSDAYRYKLMAIPKAGIFGSFVQFILESVVESFSFKFHGAAFQVLSRNLPVESLSGLGALSSSAGSLEFVREANVLPPEIVYE